MTEWGSMRLQSGVAVTYSERTRGIQASSQVLNRSVKLTRVSLFVWFWAARNWLSALPHCLFCITCVTLAVLTIPTLSSPAQYWYVKTLLSKAATEIILCDNVWKGLSDQTPVFLILSSFSLLLSSLGISVFIWHCPQFAMWCHLNTKFSQSSWVWSSERLTAFGGAFHGSLIELLWWCISPFQRSILIFTARHGSLMFCHIYCCSSLFWL